MCQSMSEGGRRCTPAVTTQERRNMVRRLNRTEPDSPEHEELAKKIENLDEARRLYGNCVSPLDISVPSGVQDILDTINSKGFTPLLVGGTVRDSLIGGTVPKDFDIEVYGTDVDNLIKVMRRDGYQVDEVGKQFGVLKVTTKGSVQDDIDISVPRRDSLTGAGHRGFSVEVDSEMSVHEASERRDYTFNALMWDYRYQSLIDPHNGVHDLKEGSMRYISEAFAEDPLRSLRGFQFASRFNVSFTPETAEFCRGLYPQAKNLAEERIATEWRKFYHKAKYPTKGMQAMREMGWSGHVPGLSKVNNAEMDKKLEKVLKASRRDNISDAKKATLYAATFMKPMNDREAEGFAKATLIGKDNQHLPIHLRKVKPAKDIDDYGMRRLAQDLAKKKLSVEDWVRYEKINGDKKFAGKILAHAKSLGVHAEHEQPYVQGRDILTMTSKKPGKWMGQLLGEAEEKQYRGDFKTAEEAFAWVKNNLPK